MKWKSQNLAIIIIIIIIIIISTIIVTTITIIPPQARTRHVALTLLFIAFGACCPSLRMVLCARGGSPTSNCTEPPVRKV